MSSASDRPGASMRAVELGVAALLLLAGVAVIYDSVRVGFRWAADGPQAGYFPFYIGLLLCGSSLWTLLRALRDRQGARDTFVTLGGLRMILAMLVPAIAFVALIVWVGFYVASFAYIGFFMVWLGKYSWWRSVAVAVGTSVVTFAMFEIWFKVPLPKGPLEAVLGLG